MHITIQSNSKESPAVVITALSTMLTDYGFDVHVNGIDKIKCSENKLVKKLKRVGDRSKRTLTIEFLELPEQEGVEINNFDWTPFLTNDPDDGMIIAGTFIKVETIADLVEQGQTYSEILKFYIEITTDDIKACVAYTSQLKAGNYYDGNRRLAQPYLEKEMGKSYGQVGCRYPECEETCQSTGCKAGEAD